MVNKAFDFNTQGAGFESRLLILLFKPENFKRQRFFRRPIGFERYAIEHHKVVFGLYSIIENILSPDIWFDHAVINRSTISNFRTSSVLKEDVSGLKMGEWKEGVSNDREMLTLPDIGVLE